MLVTLEGIDGSGKTTIISALQEAYPDAVYTLEPTDSWYGDAVQKSIKIATADPLAELFLYMADHVYHLQTTVIPALTDGKLVISDRYIDSRYAYQSASLDGILKDPLSYIEQIHQPWTILPDLTLYFDLPPALGAKRSGSTNKFEQVSFLKKVHDSYEQVISKQPDRFVRIDATLPPEDMAQLAIKNISNLL
ncbi:MAG: dTMP kinase [Halobacteriales archaeon]|nr:dTMP kinase [Halobacteriales archaeon]